MSQHTDVDVVIIGYGPVGQYLSYKLGRLGWTSACIERFPHAYAFPRAVHFDDEVGRLFQSIGLDPEANSAVQQFDTPYRWVNADNEILLELQWRGAGRCGWHISNFFHQPHLEREINAIVATEPRAQVIRGWEAVEVLQDDDGATVLARRLGGRTGRRNADLPGPLRHRCRRRQLPCPQHDGRHDDRPRIRVRLAHR